MTTPSTVPTLALPRICNGQINRAATELLGSVEASVGAASVELLFGAVRSSHSPRSIYPIWISGGTSGFINEAPPSA